MIIARDNDNNNNKPNDILFCWLTIIFQCLILFNLHWMCNVLIYHIIINKEIIYVIIIFFKLLIIIK